MDESRANRAMLYPDDADWPRLFSADQLGAVPVPRPCVRRNRLGGGRFQGSRRRFEEFVSTAQTISKSQSAALTSVESHLEAGL